MPARPMVTGSAESEETMKISMGNQMVTSEIRKSFHARFVKILIISLAFVKILIISRAFRRGKLLEFWQNASEIIS